MKIAFVAFFAVLAFASALNFKEQTGGLFYGHSNVEFVIETSVGGLDLIGSELISLDHNKIKVQYTTFNGDLPAFDVILDFTKGQLWQYQNLTGACTSYEIPKMCLTAYLSNLFHNHTEFAGHRGEHLEVYEIKHPEEPGSRSWVYGVRVHHREGEQPNAEGFFIPTRFQSHHPEQKQDYAGEWIDTFSHPHVSNATFHYPACESAIPQKMDASLSLGPVGVHPKVLTELLF